MNETPERKPSADSSIVDELLTRTRQFLTGMIGDYLKRSLDDLLRWMLGRVARYLISAALFIMAAAFLLMGGAEGLIASGMPLYLAHLAMGATSLLAGIVTLKYCDRSSGPR